MSHSFNTNKEALEIIGSLGEPSKMPCKSWGISARHCITGSKLAKIEGTICSKCYCLRGNYLFKNVTSAHQIRLDKLNKSIKNDNGESWIAAMKYLIGEDKYFRLMDAGDLQSEKMLDVFCRLALACPKTKFWQPSREYAIITNYISKGNKIPNNLVIRLSSFKFEEKGPVLLAKKLGLRISGASKTDFTCPASKQDNNCQSCRKCWNRGVFSVTYKRH